MSHDETDAIERQIEEFTQARFTVQLNLPPQSDCLESASRALRREYRDSAKWKRLRCRRVGLISDSDTGTVFEPQVGHAVEFDWTWKGSFAFRPLLLDEFE